MEHQEVATVEIPGVFVQSDMEGEIVHMKLEVKMADLLTKLGPKLYRKYVANEKEKDDPLHVSSKSSIWYTPRFAFVLAKSDIKPTGVRF